MSPFNRVRAEGDFRKLQRGYEWKAGKWQKIKDPARASYAKNIFDGQKKGRGWAKEKKLALFSAGASALLAGVAVVGSPLGGSVGSAFSRTRLARARRTC